VTETNRRVVLAQRPAGMVDERTTRLEEVAVPVPGDGEALIRGDVDRSQRGRSSKHTDALIFPSVTTIRLIPIRTIVASTC
jgi:NADPH-dependent curcumin reductase CurA